jgi:protocatechuate 3,4-dioxygenase beta subunit
MALASLLAATTASAGVSGRVVTDSGPLAGALVHVYAREGAAARAERIVAGVSRTALASARTAADGSFGLDGGPAVADVEVRAHGFAPAFALAVAGDPLTLALKAAQTRRGLVRANGKPIEGAVVAWLADDGAASGELLLRSGADGSYDVPDPDVWARRVVVWHPAYAVADAVPDSSHWDMKVPASLRHDLATGTPIEGSVIEATTGRAVPGAVLSIGGWPLGRTGPDGSFSLQNAPSGWNSIVAATGSLVGSARATTGRIVIRAGPIRSISGVVRAAKSGAPLAGALVTLVDEHWATVATAASDRAGRYRFPSLAPGRYRAHASRTGYTATSDRGQQDILDLRRQTAHSRDFALGRLPELVGRVVDEQGRPIDNASVLLGVPGVPNFYGVLTLDFNERSEATRTASDGTFRLVSEGAGTRGRLDRPLLVLKAGYAAGRLEPSELRPGQPILVTLGRGVELAGRVVAADGTPLPEVEVSIVEAPAFVASPLPAELLLRYLGRAAWIRSGGDGRFAARVHARPHHVSFRKAGYSPRTVPVEARGEGLEIVLEPAAEIRGAVVREDGSPVPGMLVRVSDETDMGSAASPSTTADDGSFVVGDLAPGSYELYAYSNERGIGLRRRAEAPSSGLRIELGPSATVRGRVVDARSRASVAQFEIDAATETDDAEAADFHFQRHVEVRDAHGAFVLADLPAGEVSLSVSAPGYLSQRLEAFPVGSEPEGGELEIALEPGATLRGRVTTPEGEAIADVGVGVQGRGQTDRPSAESDENGDYELRGLPPRTLQVEFRKEGFVTARRTVIAGETARVDATLSRGLLVRGVVLSDGAGVAGARVSVSSSAVDAEYQSAETDEHGRFTIAGLAPGRYTIKAEAEERGEVELQDVDLENAGPLRLVLERRPAALLVGTVSGLSPDEGLTSVSIVVEGEEGGSEHAFVEPSGVFRIEQAPAGRVKASGYAANPMTGTLRSSRVNELVLVPGTENSTVIEFAGDVSLSGSVIRDGEGVPRARVGFTPAERGGLGWSTSTDASGRYSLAGLEPGRYDVQVVGSGAAFSREYTIAGSGELDIDITGATLRGVVVDAADGSALRDVEVSFWALAGGRQSRADHTDSTNAHGEFTAQSLREGRYRLLTMKAGYGQQTRELELARGANPEIVIELVPAAGLGLSVVDARNEQALDANVVVRDLAGRVVANRHADVAADGSLSIALADGPYLLSTSASGYGTATLNVSAPARDIRVGLTPGGTLVVESQRELRGRVRLVRPDGLEYVRCWCNGIADIEVKGRRTTIENVTPDRYAFELVEEGRPAASAGSVEIREGQVATVSIE